MSGDAGLKAILYSSRFRGVSRKPLQLPHATIHHLRWLVSKASGFLIGPS